MIPVCRLIITASTLFTATQAAAQAISNTPLPSTRAASMGGLIPTLADEKDALSENPAGIGGIDWGKRSMPWVKKLYFPYALAEVNTASTKLTSGVTAETGINKGLFANAVTSASDGARQYGRVNGGLGLVFGRLIAVPFYDSQIEAAANDQDATLVSFRQVSSSGIAYGLSGTDKNETLSIGYSGLLTSRSELKGEFRSDDLVNSTARSAFIRDNTTTSTGLAHNVGVRWRLGKTAAPTLGVVLKNAGGTNYQVTSGTGESMTVAQNLTAALSISPPIGKVGNFHLSLGADRLLNSSIAVKRKIHLGSELAFGGIGSYATLALRAGWAAAGGSAGVALNLGLIGAEVGVTSADISSGFETVSERRFVGTVYVNVADF